MNTWKMLTTLRTFYEFNAYLTINISRNDIDELIRDGYLVSAYPGMGPENLLQNDITKKGIRFVLRHTEFGKLWEDHRISCLAFNIWPK
jgi:hypothetical protein